MSIKISKPNRNVLTQREPDFVLDGNQQITQVVLREYVEVPAGDSITNKLQQRVVVLMATDNDMQPVAYIDREKIIVSGWDFKGYLIYTNIEL